MLTVSQWLINDPTQPTYLVPVVSEFIIQPADGVQFVIAIVLSRRMLSRRCDTNRYSSREDVIFRHSGPCSRETSVDTRDGWSLLRK